MPITTLVVFSDPANGDEASFSAAGPVITF